MDDYSEIPEVQEAFRDTVATVTKDGKRNYIHPKKPKGKLYKRRTWFTVLYLLIFFTLPFIKVDGEPLFMFNIIERKFIIFGVVFWPQDFFIFGIGMITFMVFIILFTAVFGRVFCGWACPQTIFMEMIFRKIEYWIDGDSNKQMQLRKMPWNAEKIKKRTLKFVIFFAISFLIANFFLAYIISMDQLLYYIQHPGESIGTFLSLLLFTIVFFFVYWWFREQVCIVVCPYGRLQGVLLDRNSIVVAYDYERGEPRGKLSKKNKTTPAASTAAILDAASIIAPNKETTENGDCIDCFACVRVCPTGIDIRNGTQLECVNCTACIDACDAIMTSIKKPTGLIRYASENNIKERQKLKFTRRIKGYTALLSLLISLMVFLLASRSDLDVRLMRTAGMTYTTLPDGRVSNLYNLKVANKTHKDIPVTLQLENIPGEVELINNKTGLIKKDDYTHLQFFVKLKRADLHNWKTQLELGLYSGGKKVKTVKAKFIGPEIYN